MTVDFNLDDLKKLSPVKKALIVLVFCLLLGYLYYMYFLQDIITRQIETRVKLTEMQSQIAVKEKAAQQIGRYKKEVAQLNADFTTALMKLPNQREIAGLLASVVDAGRGAGVQFLLFEPAVPVAAPVKPVQAKPEGKGVPAKPEEPPKFYEDIPIKVKILGSYHNTLAFFSKVAQLPRIVTVEDIIIADAKPDKNRQMRTTTSCTLKTYKFIDKGNR
jgi:type IV pilus assembly protein PilO